MDHKKIKNSVDSIKMSESMKNRIKENCYNIEEENSVQFNFKRWVSIACAFGILFLIILGIPFINKKGELQVSNFAITAYALNADGSETNTNISSKKTTFDLSTRVRDRLTIATGGGGDNLIFTSVRLNITGEDINSITYTLNKGNFIKDVILTQEEHANLDWESSKLIELTREPDSPIYQGIKKIGKSYTVAYNEQDKFEYALALSHDGNFKINKDIIINVKVKYNDGHVEKQDIMVIQDESDIESFSASLKLK